MTFEEWRSSYYEVTEGVGPTVYCDDWTEEPNEIWHSYVVYPHVKDMEIYQAFKAWFDLPMEDNHEH